MTSYADYAAVRVPDEVFAAMAVAIDPIDPDEAVANPTFRGLVEATYRLGFGDGREAAAAAIEPWASLRGDRGRAFTEAVQLARGQGDHDA